jgi:hypothetical protein
MDSSRASSLKAPLILLVADDESTRRPLHLRLLADGWRVLAFAATEGVASSADALGAACLIADLHDRSGEAQRLLDALRSHGWQGKAILVGDLSPEGESPRHHYSLVLARPVGETVLVHNLSQLIGRPL